MADKEGRLSKAIRPPTLPEGEQLSLPSKDTLEEVRRLLKRYSKEVNRSDELSAASKAMYVDFATCFVRWIYGGFQPGSRGSNTRPWKRIKKATPKG